jgi:hypothetical protein
VFDLIIGVASGARTLWRGGVNQPSRFVRVDVKPGAPGGAVGVGAAEERDKAAGWIVDGSLRRGFALATSARTLDVTNI